MVKKLMADYRVSSIYAADPKKIRALGFTTLLLDLDNTLEPAEVREPEKRAYELVGAFQEAGIEVIIISNNRRRRVLPFAARLGVSCLALTWKPFAGHLKKFLRAHSLDPKKTLLAGDQVINDMSLAHRAGLKGLLTEPLSRRENLWGRLIRPLDKRLRAKYLSQGRLGIRIDAKEKEA
jgi:HAD superfamily phosphatase (TIGR01668 family)